MRIIKPFHERIAELWTIQQDRELSEDEELEFSQCLDLHVKHCWKYAGLYNQSLLASMTNDTTWQHEICAKIDELNR